MKVIVATSTEVAALFGLAVGEMPDVYVGCCQSSFMQQEEIVVKGRTCSKRRRWLVTL